MMREMAVKNSNGRGRKNRNTNLALRMLVAVLLVSVCVGMVACNWELDTYRALATAQVSYKTYYTSVVTLHDQGSVSDEYFAEAKSIATRIFNDGQSASGLMVEYEKLKDPATKDKISAIIAELPTLLADLAQFAKGVTPTKSNPVPSAATVARFELRSRGKLDRIKADLDSLEALL